MNRVFLLFCDCRLIGVFSTFTLAQASVQCTYFDDVEMPEWTHHDENRSTCSTIVGDFAIEAMPVLHNVTHMEPQNVF